MTSGNTSSFNALDMLNQSAALAEGGAVAVRPQKTTKFERVVNSLNSFLTTASDTIITVDGIINGPKSQNGSNLTIGGNQGNPLLPTAQHVAKTKKGNTNLGTLALWGAVAAGGSLLAYKLLSTNKKSVRSHE